jgi:hypothetical protein
MRVAARGGGSAFTTPRRNCRSLQCRGSSVDHGPRDWRLGAATWRGSPCARRRAAWRTQAVPANVSPKDTSRHGAEPSARSAVRGLRASSVAAAEACRRGPPDHGRVHRRRRDGGRVRRITGRAPRRGAGVRAGGVVGHRRGRAAVRVSWPLPSHMEQETSASRLRSGRPGGGDGEE